VLEVMGFKESLKGGHKESSSESSESSEEENDSKVSSISNESSDVESAAFVSPGAIHGAQSAQAATPVQEVMPPPKPRTSPWKNINLQKSAQNAAAKLDFNDSGACGSIVS